VTTNFTLLRSRLENERKHLTEELEQIKASVRPVEERREGSPFGKREEEATEVLELEKRLALEKNVIVHLAEIELPQANLCLKCKTNQAKNAKNKPSSG